MFEYGDFFVTEDFNKAAEIYAKDSKYFGELGITARCVFEIIQTNNIDVNISLDTMSELKQLFDELDKRPSIPVVLKLKQELDLEDRKVEIYSETGNTIRSQVDFDCLDIKDPNIYMHLKGLRSVRVSGLNVLEDFDIYEIDTTEKRENIINLATKSKQDLKNDINNEIEKILLELSEDDFSELFL